RPSRSSAVTQVSMLLAFIVEAGSALGLTVVTTATRGNRSPNTTGIQPGTKPSTTDHPPHAGPRLPAPERPATRHLNSTRVSASGDDISNWASSRLDVGPKASVPARHAYRDYCSWARGRGIGPSTETAFCLK